MAQLAIKGHATRGKEVIKAFEMLGGREVGYSGLGSQYYYYIDEYGNIAGTTELPNNKTFVIYTLEEFIKNFPYKVGDKVLLKGVVKTIKQACWDNTENEVIYKLETNVRGFSEEYYVYHYDLQPYKEETMESKPNLLQQLKEYFDNTPRDVLEKEWNELSYLNKIGPTVDEYLECVKKYRQSNQYPKTYEECCEVLGCKANDFFTEFSCNGDDVEISDYEDKLDDLLQNFRKLRYYRDAYWKIAGEQMGLGKPWEPDWKKQDKKYIISVFEDAVIYFENETSNRNTILAFPTEEMRNAFYQNFKELIESCKELL